MSIIRLTKTLVLAIVLTFALDSYAQKMSPEELIAKHLDSIGTKEKRATIKNQLIVCDVEFKGAGGPGVFGGKAIIFSAGEKNVWGMNLNANNSEPDKFGYNGKSTQVAFIRPGVRSVLGAFILKYNKLVQESLLGGTLSNSWALLNMASKKSKVSYDGTKKIDGKEAFVLSYTPKGGSEMNIKIFLDSETYRHIRTEYSIVIAASLGSIDSSAGRDSSRYRVVESFSNFRDMGGLTLPSEYKVNYSFFGGTSAQTPQGRTIGGSSSQPTQDKNRDLEWAFKVTNFSFNQETDEKAFDIYVK
jgi:hypothetical protein